MINSTKQKHTQ